MTLEPKHQQPGTAICTCTPGRCRRQPEAVCAANLADDARQDQEAEREYNRGMGKST